jgi:mono/diheme cytochrome c family protein
MKFQLVKAFVCTVAAFMVIVLASTATAQLNSPNRPRVLMPDGPAREVLRSHCVTCHGIDEYGFYSLGREGWDRMLDELHVGDLTVDLAGRERAMLLDYLADTFGEDDIALPRDYQYQESESFSDTDGRVFMEASCAGCHAHGITVAFDRQDTEEGWTSILMRERDRIRAATPDDFARRSRGLVISDEMLEKAAQWLGKVRGVDGR